MMATLRRGQGSHVREVMLSVLFVLLLPSSSALAQVAEQAPRRTLGLDEAVLLGRSAVHAAASPLRWDETELRTGARLLIALAAVSSIDDAGRSFMRGQQTALRDDAARTVERLGTVENFTVLGGLFAAGLVLDDSKSRSVAVEGLASSLVAGALITPTLQFVLGRSRPRRNQDAHTFDAFSGNISLPSGHTTQAFAVASVIATEYDHVAVQIAAYGLAGGVAVSRMYHDAHFLSDVAAAAIIGTLVGRSVAAYGRAWRERVDVRPLNDAGGGYGVQVKLPVR